MEVTPTTPGDWCCGFGRRDVVNSPIRYVGGTTTVIAFTGFCSATGVAFSGGGGVSSSGVWILGCVVGFGWTSYECGELEA